MLPPLAARKRTTWSAYSIVWLTMQKIAWGTARVFFRKCHYRSSTITVLHINYNYIVLAIRIQTLNALQWIPFGCNSNISTSSNEERDNSIDITNSSILFWQSKCKWHLAISYYHWQRWKYCKTRVIGLLCQGTRYEIRRRRRWSWCEEMREENRKRHNERQAKSNRIKLKWHWQCLCPETDTMCALCVSFSFTVIVIISHCECYGACLIVELAISYTLAHISQTDTQTNLRVTWIWMSERMRVSVWVWVSEFLIKILLLELLSDDRNDQTKERFVTCGAMRYIFTHIIQFILPQFTCIFLV